MEEGFAYQQKPGTNLPWPPWGAWHQLGVVLGCARLCRAPGGAEPGATGLGQHLGTRTQGRTAWDRRVALQLLNIQPRTQLRAWNVTDTALGGCRTQRRVHPSSVCWGTAGITPCPPNIDNNSLPCEPDVVLLAMIQLSHQHLLEGSRWGFWGACTARFARRTPTRQNLVYFWIVSTPRGSGRAINY